MNRLLGSLLAFGFLFVWTPATKAESTLEKIQRTGVLSLAIREDAAPFGYLGTNNNLQGYCLGFFALLEAQLLEKIERNSLSVKLLKSTSSNRFNLVGSQTVNLECGPNTIRPNIPQNTSFTTGFFVTGVQFLVRENNSLELDSDLENVRLGVIEDTSTEEFISQRYPLAIQRRYKGVTARTRGIEAVEQGKIDAMVSDGILLRAEAQRQELSAAQLPLIPDIPLTCDRYGMIIPAQDPQWQELVNSVIDSPAAAALSDAWFGRLFSYTQQVSKICE